MPESKRLSIQEIRIDGGTQPRLEIDEGYIKELVAALDDGATLPPLVVYFDGKSYWLADGFHRWHAYNQADVAEVDAEIHAGTKREAILYSVGANSTHGLRRTTEDKRQAVLTLLNDVHPPCEAGQHTEGCDCWAAWSDREIARQCGVDHKTVGKYRAEVEPVTGEFPSQTRTYTHNKSGEPTTMNTANIGGRQEEEPDPEALIPNASDELPLVWINGEEGESYAFSQIHDRDGEQLVYSVVQNEEGDGYILSGDKEIVPEETPHPGLAAARRYAEEMERKHRANPPMLGDPTPPWADFEAEVRGVTSQLRSVSRRLHEVLEFDGKTITAPYGQFYTHGGTVGAINAIVKTLEENLPGEATDEKPGYRPVRSVKARQAVEKGGA